MVEPIDAVITWVDGGDPLHRMKREKYTLSVEKNAMDCGMLEGRFIEADEIKYCIHSIRKYATWIRNIFLVTDEQCPTWLTLEYQNKLNIQLVDHKVIFGDHLHFLPTFNNLSINSLLWKIPGLSNKYILFNDDTLFVSKVLQEDFFQGEKVVIRGAWKRQNPTFSKRIKRIVKQIIINNTFNNLGYTLAYPYVNGALLAGYKEIYFETLHTPVPLKADIQREYFLKHPDVLIDNVKFRFRNKSQFGPDILFVHQMIKIHKAIECKDVDSVIFIPRSQGLMDQRVKFELLKATNSIKFLCFQDMAYLRERNPAEFKEVNDYLSDLILT